jgi:tetratricopeptide (TPR) repeat protein
MGGKAALLASLALALSAGAPLARAAAPPAHCDIGKVAELPVTMAGLRPQVTLAVDGVPTTFLVSSGSFYSFLNPAVVARLKLPTHAAPFGYYVTGTGGSDNRVDVATAHTFNLDGQDIPKVPFLVMEHPGSAAQGVLGQNVLSLFDTEYDLANGVIRLLKPSADCRHADTAYWAGDKMVTELSIASLQPEDPHLYADGKINGKTVRVEFSTGSDLSVIKRSAAERLGFRPDAPGVHAAGVSRGVGPRVAEVWEAPFDSFELGSEKITNTHLRVANIELDHADMLLGADFFLSHRVYVSRQQHRIFFTYNGGPVFRLEQAAAAPVPAPGSVGAQYAGAPTDGAGFARRGDALMSRREFAAALADFTKASELEPAEPQHFRDLARAHIALRQPALAMADFDQSLKLKPDDAASLVGRGELHLASHDLDHAKADFNEAIRLDPGRAEPVANLYLRAGRFEEAVAGYDAWLAAHPNADNASAVLNSRCRSRALWNHDLDKAIADCDLALKKGPKIAAYFDSRGLAHLRRGELDLALADYNKALEMQPKLAWALYGRGVAKIEKGDKAGGEADLSAAAAVAPNLAAIAKRVGLVAPAAG